MIVRNNSKNSFPNIIFSKNKRNATYAYAYLTFVNIIAVIVLIIFKNVCFWKVQVFAYFPDFFFDFS